MAGQPASFAETSSDNRNRYSPAAVRAARLVLLAVVALDGLLGAVILPSPIFWGFAAGSLPYLIVWWRRMTAEQRHQVLPLLDRRRDHVAEDTHQP